MSLTIHQLISAALEEDLPNGDITTESLGLTKKMGSCQLVAKQKLRLSGCDFFTQTVLKLEPEAQLTWFFSDGDDVDLLNRVCEIEGNLIEILKAERVALNFLGHFSGIATLTSRFVEQAKNIKILDTRKTLPLYRTYEKKAVKDGGGLNHRMTLSDAILIKENHIRASGGLTQAVHKIQQMQKNAFIEVEVRNIQEVKEALSLGVQRLLLDNMDNDTLVSCLQVIPQSIETEASGNMTIERIKEIDSFGIDYASVGALTHSAPCADLSLLFHW